MSSTLMTNCGHEKDCLSYPVKCYNCKKRRIKIDYYEPDVWDPLISTSTGYRV